MSYAYNTHFLDYATTISRRSAERLVPLLCETLQVKSVLDVGCASGTWLHVWTCAGVQDVHGIDGEYVDRQRLEIPSSSFTSADLTRPFCLNRKFDLVQSLEVGEHIRPEASEVFVDQIVKHSNGLVLFSAAPPGQGGEYHVNEQSYEFWRALFRKRGFFPFDYLRPIIHNDGSVCFWYRLNTILYVRQDRVDRLLPEVRETRIADESPIGDNSSYAFRLRKVLVRALPYQVQHRLAQLKARCLARSPHQKQAFKR